MPLLFTKEFSEWAQVVGVYGPRPSLEQQAYGTRIELTPTALLRSRSVAETYSKPQTNWSQYEPLYWTYRWDPTQLSEFFIIPYRVKVLLMQDKTATLGSFLDSVDAECGSVLYTEDPLPLIKIARTPRYRLLDKDNPARQIPGVQTEGSSPTNSSIYDVISWDFGYPDYTSRYKLGVDLNADSALTFNTRLAGAVPGVRRQISISLDFEALLFDARSEFHQDYYKHLASATARDAILPPQVVAL